MSVTTRTFFASTPIKAKDAMCNPAVMSVLLSVYLSVCNRNAWNVCCTFFPQDLAAANITLIGSSLFVIDRECEF